MQNSSSVDIANVNVKSVSQGMMRVVDSLDGFKKAFSSARKNNQNTFIYKGKLYSTRLNN